MSSYLFEFKAIVNLNNSGISLLERGCFREAMKTFSDALSIMKTVSLRSEACQGKTSDLQNIKDKIRNAAQRLSDPASSKKEKNATIQILSDEDIASSLYVCGLDSSSSKDSTIYLIRMDPTDHETPLEKDAVIDSATLMYNFAMTYRFLSATRCSPSPTDLYDRPAFNLLGLAYGSLTSHDTFYQQSDSNNNNNMERIVLVTLLSLRELVTLSETLVEEESDQQQRAYVARLDCLQDSIRSLRTQEESYKLSAQTARAA